MNLRLLLCVPLLSVLVCCQEPVAPKPAEPPAAQPVLDEVMRQFRQEGIEFDAKAKTVSIPAVVNQMQDPVEYLLIHRKGKRHEAMFWTKAKPSVLNAALLMLGLEPGKNASYVEKNPPPTLEEIEAGADPVVITPPSGTPIWMTVKWKDEDGKVVEHCVEDLLLDLSTQKPVVGATWVYLGGRMAQIYRGEPEVYVADFEGNLISVCYLTPDNHLFTMVHKDARDDQNWFFADAMPKVDTEVTFVFHKDEPALHQEREARVRREQAAAVGETAKPATEAKPADK